MQAQIRPNRLSISDRFPMLGFTIRTDGTPQRAEITVATDPALFDNLEGRMPDTFFSTGSQGPLQVTGGEAVYVLPPEVLSRFIGKERLYFALATAPAANGGAYNVQVRPNKDSVYISLAGLTGRSLRRVRMFPHRTVAGRQGFDDHGAPALTWAGDRGAPGMIEAGGNGTANGPRGAKIGSGHSNGNGDANRNGRGNDVRQERVSSRPANGGDGSVAGPGTEAKINGNGAARQASGNEMERHANGGAASRKGANGSVSNGGPVPYDDGFGELPPAVTETEPARPASQGLSVGPVGFGERRAVPKDAAAAIGLWDVAAMNTALARFPQLGTVASAARTFVDASGLTVGIGPIVAGEQRAPSGGLIIAPEGQVGTFGVTGPDLNVLAGIGAKAQITILGGGVAMFGRIRFAVQAEVPGTTATGLAALLDEAGVFAGVTFQAELHVPPPFTLFGIVRDAFVAAQGVPAEVQTPPASAQAFDLGRVEIGEQVALEAPDVHILGTVASAAAQAALLANPALAPLLTTARAAAETGDVSVGIGPAISGGIVGGAQLGSGIIIASGNRLGAYGSAEVMLGAIASISLTAQITVLRGGIESFEGISYAAGFSAGEGLVGGGAAIFDSDRRFLGVSVGVGVGAGLSPLDVYVSVQRQVAAQLGYATAFGGGLTTAQAMGGSSVALARRHVPAWSDLLTWTVPAAIASAVSRRGMIIQTLASAQGQLNLDRYEVRVRRLPPGLTAEALIDHIRKNIATFVDARNTEFDFYSSADRVQWTSGTAVGTIFNLNIFGPDNAAVVASMVEPRRFRLTTIEAPATGSHPVSGHREFGIRSEGGDWVVYTRAADRYSYPVGGSIAFAGADHLWQSFQRKVAEHVNAGGGAATVLPRFTLQLDWSHARTALSGLPGTAGARAKALGYDPYAVEVRYRVFIPSPAVKGPPGMDDFGGDGRGFSYDGGTSRGEITAIVNLTEGLGIDSITVSDRHWSESTAYDGNDTFHVAGKPDWWLDKRDRATPTERATLRATEDNLRIYSGVPAHRGVRVVAEHASAVTVVFEGSLPLSRVAPDIDADVSILFRNRNGLIQAKALGSHDGFPAHELYINGEKIYRYDPVKAGKSPKSLFGTADRDVDTDWVTVARLNVARIGGQSLGRSLAVEESFTINWDEVQQIAQPTGLSCWAAAAAMVVGWRDRMSLTPDTIAEIAANPIATTLDPAQVRELAAALDLVAEPPQSYSPESFRRLLENNGPLWVGAAVPQLHVVVVTGLYSEGEQLYVRVTDPWDRAVGTPGSPGPRAQTHATGSRYIMTWEDFVAEYEAAPTNYADVDLQILHSGGTNGREPNRGGTVPPGYAAGLMQAANDAAEAVQRIGIQATHRNGAIQKNGVPAGNGAGSAAATPNTVVQVTLADATAPISALEIRPLAAVGPVGERWNALATEAFGGAAEALSGLPALAAERGWTIGVGRDDPSGYAAGGIGVDSDGALFRYSSGAPASMPKNVPNGHPPLLFTVAEGAPKLFGLWRKARGFSTGAGGATGAILLDAADMPIAMAVRLRPSADLVERLSALAEAVGRSEAAMTTSPPAAVAAFQTTAGPLPGNGARLAPPNGSGGRAAPTGFPPPSVRIFRSEVQRDGVEYSLFLMDGTLFPATPPAMHQGLVPGTQIVIDSWPYVDGPSGRSWGGIALDWSFGGGGVANVRVSPAGGQALDGWKIRVYADIGAGPSTETETKLLVTIRTTFSRGGEADMIGVTELVLYGSGRHEMSHREEIAGETVPA
jgi:hypothetical protein